MSLKIPVLVTILKIYLSTTTRGPNPADTSPKKGIIATPYCTTLCLIGIGFEQKRKVF